MVIDLRSDTVTKPTRAMREAMYIADVGDDVYGEDPTVNELEALGAEMTGKEAGLFVASGTMGNQVAIMAHTQRGDEVICESEAHIFFYEVGAMAVLSNVQARLIKGHKGIISPSMIEEAIRPEDLHQPRTSLICLENTHNRAGGTYYTPNDLAGIYDKAQHYQVQVHMDGARLFNAAVAQDLPVSALTQYTDSVTFCLSKGLCAPIGSLLVGSKEFVNKARRCRKMLGGGMRQAGVIAAAGLIALKNQVERLAEDHENAKILAEAIAELGYDIDITTVQTNIVLFNVQQAKMNAAEFVDLLNKSYGIKASVFGVNQVRMVTHYGISRDDIDKTINVLTKIIKGN